MNWWHVLKRELKQMFIQDRKRAIIYSVLAAHISYYLVYYMAPMSFPQYRLRSMMRTILA